MSLRDLCDTAYVILLGRVERQSLADRQSVGMAALQSGTQEALDVEWPSFDEAKSLFDQALVADPVEADPKRALLAEMGVL